MKKYTEKEVRREVLHQILEVEKGLLYQIWEKLLPTLGTITLSAVFRRILRKVGEIYPSFSELVVTEDGFEFNRLERKIEKIRNKELEDGFSMLISELILFLSEMTGNILISEIEDMVSTKKNLEV